MCFLIYTESCITAEIDRNFVLFYVLFSVIFSTYKHFGKGFFVFFV